MAVVGSAEVVVRAITTQVKNDIRKAFNDARPDVQKAGRDAGKDFSSEFNRAVGQNLRPALQSTMQQAGKEAADAVSSEFSRNAGDTLEREGTNAGRRAAAGVRAGASSGSGGGNPLAGMFSWFREFDSEAANAGAALTNLMAMGNFAGAALSGLIGTLSALVSGLFAVASAAGQAAGAIAVLPGLLGAVGQAFGAVKLGFGGVGEAIKLGAKAQQAAASAGTAAGAAAAKSGRNSAAAIAAAKRLQKAQDALTQAQKEARKAQQELNDAQKDAESGLEEQERAEAALAAAQMKRTQVLTDPNATAAGGADAQKAVDDAKTAADSIADARAAAQKRALAASEKNDKAQRKLAAAEAARNKAQDASKNAAKAGGIQSPAVKAAQAYQQQLQTLTPAAQAFVEQVLRMREAFKEVGDAVAEEMFPKLTKALQIIEKSSFFDILKKELTVTGGIAGEAGLQIAEAFTTKSNMTRFQTWLQGNNDILDTFVTKTSDGTTPVQSLTNLLFKLGVAIQPVTKRFAEWIGTIVTGVDKSARVGEMTDYFNRAGDVAAKLGRIIGNVFGAIGNLGGAAAPAGQGLLDSFESVTAKFEEWTQKISDDGTAGAYFSDVADNLRDISDLVALVAEKFGGLADNKGIGDLATSLEPAVENIAKIFDNFNNNGGVIGDFATELSEIALTFADSKGIELFFGTLDLILGTLNDIIALPGVKQGLGLVAGFMAVSRAIQFSQKIGNFFLKGITGGLSNMKKNANETASVFKRAFGGVQKTMGKVTSGIGAVIKKMPGLKGLGEKIQGKGQSMSAKGAAKMQRPAAPDPDTGDAKDQGESVGKAIAQGMAEGIGKHSALVIEAIDEMVDDLIKAVKARLDINSPSRVMHRFGGDTVDGYVDGVRDGKDDAYRAGADLADAAADGAASQTVTAKVKTAAEPAGKATKGAVGGAIPDLGLDNVTTGLDKVDKKMEDSTKKTGKFKKGMGSLGGGIKMLSGGLMGLMGGPLGAIMLLVTGFTMLYKKSPEFKKFVDNIVKAVKPMVDAIAKFVTFALDKLFEWINSKMPTIKRIAGDVFSAISGFVTKTLIPAWNNYLLPALKKFGSVVASVMPYVGKIISTVFKAIKFYITNILIPVWKMVFRVIKSMVPIVGAALGKVKNVVSSVFGAIKKIWNGVLKPVFNAIKSVAKTAFGGVVTFINNMKNAFSRAKSVMSAAKNGLVGVFNGVKNAAKTPIKWVIDTVWNNGLVSMADKIPGVNAGGWRVSTKGWATGGWTGPGQKYDVAGLVHADEFVVKKSSRRRVEQMYPGLLDYINRTGAVPKSLGYADGGLVKKIAGGAKDKLLGGVKWTGSKLIGGVRWTYKKAKEMLDAIKKATGYLTNLPGKISSNMSSAWGNLVKGMPKAASNKAVQAINNLIPNGIPGIGANPLNKPFPGVEFRANGGRVRKGSPYVVGELRPELFIPDSSGTIIPSLQNLSSKRTAEGIMNQIQQLGGNVDMMTSNNNTTNSGSRNMTININNPKAERSTRSVTKAMRDKAIANGWGV